MCDTDCKFDRGRKEPSQAYRGLIKNSFPLAIQGDQLIEIINSFLQSEGFTAENTLFGTSCCPDEINEFVTNFKNVWGEKFPLAGLGGIPFTGYTGFDTFSQHRPDDGNLFVLYASHIGIDESGEIGSIYRRGMSKKSIACGSAISAYNLLTSNTDLGNSSTINDEWDLQQKYMQTIVKENLPAISNSSKSMVTLTQVIYDVIHNKIMKIIPVGYDGNVALLGGIQINTSLNYHDYFSVKEFKIINPVNNMEIDMLGKIQGKLKAYG